MTVGVPDITLDPLQLVVTSTPNLVTTRTLSIGNVGAASLSWHISESPARTG